MIRSSPHYKPETAQRRILVVDDDSAVLNFMDKILTRAGFKVSCLSNLGQARQALTEDSFDLVLTDLYLGDTSLGYEVAEMASAMRPPLPVILVTGRPSFDSAHEALRSRISEIVVKPIDGNELVQACNKIIQQWSIRRQTEQLEIQNSVLAQVLPRAIEAKDPTTKGHSERVVQYVDTLASRCGVESEDRESLRLAALLHDVGKIGIPNSILSKPGGLTVEEREKIQEHPAFGYEILKPLQGNENVRLWVYQHHERWDGKGYPNGLSEDEVALPGRILVLAEVYDALAEARSYKPAWPNNRIAELFRKEAGHHFDPELAHMVASGLDQEGSRFFTAEAKGLF